MTPINRRRFLTLSACAAALPAYAGPQTVARWQGVALGAPASMQIAGLSALDAAPVFAAVEAEITKLERVFSLFLPHSQLSRLNRAGQLDRPAPELLEVLSLSGRLHDATGGAFDPTVQPLWLALALGAEESAMEAARAAIGWRGVRFDTARIELARPGMALTLNGIAQGAITDRIAALMRSRGLADVLIDMGEIAALGQRQPGQDWRVGITDPSGAIRRRLTLSDRALATSAPAGTLLDAASGQGHILGPSGQAPQRLLASVSADRAVLADGLSTALCLLDAGQAADALARFPGSAAELVI